MAALRLSLKLKKKILLPPHFIPPLLLHRYFPQQKSGQIYFPTQRSLENKSDPFSGRFLKKEKPGSKPGSLCRSRLVDELLEIKHLHRL
jgi:hypothetical protein